MVTGETKALSEKFKDDITFRFLDRIVVKGRSAPAEVYELVGFTQDITPEIEECLSIFERGIIAYQAQKWDAARSLFERSSLREIHKDCNPSLIMIERCHYMQAHPPAKDWDGVWTMKEK